jgi:two-component system sensor histidine kinase KdpD
MPATAQPAMTQPDVTDARCVALFASALQPSDAPTADMAAREYELLARVAAGPENLQAVLDRAREATGMDSVTLLERGHGDGSALGLRSAGWTPVAVSGRPPPGRPDEAAVMVPATGSLCLALGGRSLPAASRRSLDAFAAQSAVALIQQRLAAAAAAAQAAMQANRMRTLLLATVSHDLRTPLAAAKAAVSGLRCRDVQLTADDHDELLATAEESLDLLTHLAASLLDMSRLHAGALPVFPRPVDLAEIITRSLGSLGPPAQAVKVDLPPGLPQVIADPPIMERVIANLTSNALRYSPTGSPPLLTAGIRGDRIELRVVDRGPGVPLADRERMFAPFQRLGDTGASIGVGLGRRRRQDPKPERRHESAWPNDQSRECHVAWAKEAGA